MRGPSRYPPPFPSALSSWANRKPGAARGQRSLRGSPPGLEGNRRLGVGPGQRAGSAGHLPGDVGSGQGLPVSCKDAVTCQFEPNLCPGLSWLMRCGPGTCVDLWLFLEL